MISLINMVFHLIRKNKIIKALRFPSHFIFRSHLLGLTLGLFIVLVMICQQNLIISSNLPLYYIIIYVLLFLIGTWCGGSFIITLTILVVLSQFLTIIPNLFWNGLITYSQYYLCAYLFGAILGTLYNDLVYMYLIIFHKERIKLVFAFDPKKKFNVIKSPYETEEHAMLSVLKPMKYYTQKVKKEDHIPQNTKRIQKLILKAYNHPNMTQDNRDQLTQNLPGNPANDTIEQQLIQLTNKLQVGNSSIREKWINILEKYIEPVVEDYLNLKSRKLYNYKINEKPKHPYTIVFMANPKILKCQNPPQNVLTYKIDPIIHNIESFLQSVQKALCSFETNKVLGCPEIWSRIRIIAVFDKKLTKKEGDQCAMVKPYLETLCLDNILVDNLLRPEYLMCKKYKKIIEDEYITVSGFNKDDLKTFNKETDVIFAMSACKEYSRSSAIFADLKYSDTGSPGSGEEFVYNLDHFTGMKNGIILPVVNGKRNRSIKGNHEYYTNIPGRVALNILDATHKTYIHEFAHAMSSICQGAIADEYFDKVQMGTTGNGNNNPVLFFVNRIERRKLSDGKFVCVPKVFVEYKNVLYHADRNHPSSEENWLGYFPARQASASSCIMDQGYYNYQFDTLISDFIYDRLMAKLNR